MLPERLLRVTEGNGRIVPDFLGPEDEPRLRDLLELARDLAGRPKAELEARLADPSWGPPSCRCRMAIHVLERLVHSRSRSAVPPRRAREILFSAAARRLVAGRMVRPEVLAEAAGELGVSGAALEDSLFADLPGARRVDAPPEALSPRELALRTNQALVEGLLFRSSAVRLELEGNSRAVVRHVQLAGLICLVDGDAAAERARLEISGPFALFRRTTVYGRALAGLPAPLAWCRRFRLEAEVVLWRRPRTLRLATGDPFLPSAEPRRFDSALERTFARDFTRLAPDWDLIREPEPLRAGRHLFFPDFAIVHRRDPARRWLLEIVGFWTPEYLARKLERLREAKLGRFLLAIDEDRNCAEADLPPGVPVVRFRRRIDAARILQHLEGA